MQDKKGERKTMITEFLNFVTGFGVGCVFTLILFIIFTKEKKQ